MIIYTRHAEEQLRFRNISKSQIQASIRKFNFIKPGRENKKSYYKKFRNKFLRVILIKKKQYFVIITAHWISAKRVMKKT